MSHQRYPSHDPIKEPHSISLKVLRLSRPSLVTQHPIDAPLSSPSTANPPPAPASLAYRSLSSTHPTSNPAPFLLTPALNLPLSFGSAYVGETFNCTLCANNDLPPDSAKDIRDVRIDAEMKTPGLGAVQRLELSPAGPATDVSAGDTLQKIVSFDLKEEGNHVLAVTVSYYEATETSGKTRTFRKLYQFICKASLIVRTKTGPLHAPSSAESPLRRWILEAQLENCSEDVVELEKVVLEVEPGITFRDYNWEASASARPVLHPGEVEQVCFIVSANQADGGEEAAAAATAEVTPDGRIIFGSLGIGWRGEMGNRGFLSTGKLGSRVAVR